MTRYTYGAVGIEYSDDAKEMTGAKDVPMQWCIWPEGMPSIFAVMSGEIIGPFDTEEEAEAAAEAMNETGAMPQ